MTFFDISRILADHPVCSGTLCVPIHDVPIPACVRMDERMYVAWQNMISYCDKNRKKLTNLNPCFRFAAFSTRGRLKNYSGVMFLHRSRRLLCPYMNCSTRVENKTLKRLAQYQEELIFRSEAMLAQVN